MFDEFDLVALTSAVDGLRSAAKNCPTACSANGVVGHQDVSPASHERCTRLALRISADRRLDGAE
jgi:hypothetical protein